ncbi:MAG TPA: type II secretion system protein [Desulfuromonadales bacterium]|nr:type II secretion system protein [Desulfuromonadales bacterium]
MKYRNACSQLYSLATNKNGFTFLMAIYLVMIIGILSAFTGKTWSLVAKREREKELIFRGSQIKEAIENWYNPAYTVQGVKRHRVIPLTDLKYLLDDPTTLTHLRFLPQSYATKLDDKNPRCAPDCATLKIYQDPMTGKEWTLLRGTITNGAVALLPEGSIGGGIVGVASKSEAEPLKTDFKDTALENMMVPLIGTAPAVPGAAPTPIPTISTADKTKESQDIGKTKKYSDWKFMWESVQKNDHSKIYRAYHESW